MRDYAKSMAWLARAKQVTPGGASTLSKRSRAYVEGVSPAAYTDAAGCRVRDVGGQDYTDWCMALCSVPLGYAHPTVTAAVVAAAERGWSASIPSYLEIAAAEALMAHIPCAQDNGMCRWVNSGTESSEAAIRVARRVTGKSVILSSGYHGWTSTFMALQPFREGIPLDYDRMIASFAYNDLPSLQRALKAHRGDVAAILLEPTLYDVPAHGFLEALRELATKHKALLIFDEIVTLGRWHRGGYQAVCGVTPDLATLGKSIGNGFPVSALVGPGRYMVKADCISGTYCGNAMALAAVVATMKVYDEVPVCWHIAEIGVRLMAGLRQIVTRHGDPSLRVDGQPQHPRLVWDGDTDNVRLSTLIQGLALGGVIWHFGGANPCLAHSEWDVARLLKVFELAFASIDYGVPLKGLPFGPAFQRDPGAKKEAA